MPKSKKARNKPYNPVKALMLRRGWWPDTDTLERLDKLIENAELTARLTLPNGTASENQILSIRLLLNGAVGIVMCEAKSVAEEFGDTWWREHSESYVPGQLAINAIYNRGVKRGRFVASGDELRAVWNTLPYARAIIDWFSAKDPETGLRKQPRRCLHILFRFHDWLSKLDPEQTIVFTDESLPRIRSEILGGKYSSI